jgi:protein TonB
VNLGSLAAGAAGIEDPSHTMVPAKAERGNFPPAYPRAAAVRGEHGTVKLRIHVGADGGVTAVDVVESSGSAALDKAARDAILKWRYQPAQDANGNPAADVVDLSVEFQLN